MSQSHQRVSLETAYVLHQRSYRDTSLIIEAFTPNYGRVGLVARGVRKQKGRWQALMQPFTPVLLSWSGRGELATVTDAELNGQPHILKGQVLLSAFYVNELLTRLLHRDDPHLQLFDTYHVLLGKLAAISIQANFGGDLQRQLRLFEKTLLQETGYGLVLAYEVSGGELVEPESYYHYVLGEGPLLVEGDPRKFDGLVMKGASLLALAQERLDDADSLRDAKRLMRAALDQYLGGRPLHSRQLLIEMQKAVAASATRATGEMKT